MNMNRLPAVLATTGHSSHASIYTAIKEGLFPKPVRIGTRAVAWPQSEVTALVAARVAGKTNAEIRALVERLHVARSTALADVESALGLPTREGAQAC